MQGEDSASRITTNGLVLGEVVDFKAQKLIKLQMLNRITNAQ
jgi:hypothetical protein